MTTYLDTHTLIWLYEGNSSNIGQAGRAAIDTDQLLAPPAAVLELELLHEIGRLNPSASKLVSALAADIGLRVCELPFSTIVDYALKEKWGRDPFDRLIVANAKAAGAPLVTKDRRIRQHYSKAIW